MQHSVKTINVNAAITYKEKLTIDTLITLKIHSLQNSIETYSKTFETNTDTHKDLILSDMKQELQALKSIQLKLK